MEQQYYRCSIPCDVWECYSNGPHICDESKCPTSLNKCGLYPTAKCVPTEKGKQIVLKSEKRKKINTEE